MTVQGDLARTQLRGHMTLRGHNDSCVHVHMPNKRAIVRPWGQPLRDYQSDNPQPNELGALMVTVYSVPTDMKRCIQ